VIIADMRSSMVAAGSAAAVGCVVDVDVDIGSSQVLRAESNGVAATPLDVARSAWEY
jgi:hypothetical protein